ncbi:MAG: ABC transporter ATP-binding protein/permease [Lachnospiraceae bacterium]|nr:ABC transporter ATP-binding protein/permease [Lachnospiraceae bacterium]
MFQTLKLYINFCGKEDARKVKAAMALGVIKVFFNSLRLMAIALVGDGIIDGDLSWKHVWGGLAIMGVSVVGQILIGMKGHMLQVRGGYHCSAEKRMKIAEHLRYLPMGFFNANSLGHITSVTTNTMEMLGDVATRIVMTVTQGVLTTGVITIFVFCFDWRIGLITVVGLTIFMIINSSMQRATKPIAPRKHNADEGVVTSVIEYVQGIAEVKNYNMTDKTAKKLDAAITEKTKADTALEFCVLPRVLLQDVVTKLTGVAMCVASLIFYFSGTMELLYCIIMMVSSFMIYESLELMGVFAAMIRNVNIAVTKANEILDMPAMDIKGEQIKPKNRDIELKNVEFSYEERKIIDGISLKIPEKTTTAIVGPSGGGKTTLTNLIARFWDVQSGSVTLGGIDVKDYSFDSLMENFSFVFQRVYLFKDTIANNIRFGNPDASMEQVIEAAKKARCHDFISALPDGYETMIGEGGASLSGGEKQRISIARAILKDSPIIILDEATANVDPENEAELTAAIDELTREKTIIMIAHRLKTVRNADKIFVIDHGKIAQQGTHDELMAQEGIYKNFIEGREEAASWKIA